VPRKMQNTKSENWSSAFEGIKEPSPNDVLSGRGGRSNHHAGNVNFRKIVNKIRPTYIRSDKREKPIVSFQVVEEIRCLDPPGRFLRQEKKNELWYEIGNKKAREKASQALRDGTSMFSRKCTPDTDLTSSPFRKPESVRGKVKCESSDDSSVDTPSLASTDTFQGDCKFKKPDLKAPSNLTNHKRKQSTTNSISKKTRVYDEVRDLMCCRKDVTGSHLQTGDIANKSKVCSAVSDNDLIDSPLDVCRYQSLIIDDDIIGDNDYFGLGDTFDDEGGINIIQDTEKSSNSFFSFFDIPEPRLRFIDDETSFYSNETHNPLNIY